MENIEFTDDDFETSSIVESAKNTVLKKAYLEGDEVELDEDELNEISEEEVKRALSSSSQNDEKDVFDDCYNLLKKKLGTKISARVYKDGELLGAINDTTFSWDRVIDEFGSRFGAGVYKVIIRNSGRFAGQQEQSINTQKVETKNEPSFDPMQLLKEMKKMQDDNNAKQNEAMEASKFENNNMMKTMMDSMSNMMNNSMQAQMALMMNSGGGNNAQQNNANMMLEMQKMNMEMMRTMADNQKDMIRELRAEFKESLSAITNQITREEPKSGLNDPLAFFQFMKDNENSSIEHFMKMQELANAKAELEKANSDSGNDSITDKALKALPAILGVMNKGGVPSPMPQIPQRRPLANPQRRKQRPSQARTIVNESRSTTVSQVSPRPSVEKQATVSTVAPKVAQVEAREQVPVVEQDVNVQETPGQNEVAQVVNNETPATMVSEDINAQIAELVLPIVLDGLMKQSPAADVATLCHSTLKGRVPQDIVAEIHNIFTTESMIAIAKEGGIYALAEGQGQAAELEAWLGELNYELETQQQSTEFFDEDTEGEDL